MRENTPHHIIAIAITDIFVYIGSVSAIVAISATDLIVLPGIGGKDIFTSSAPSTHIFIIMISSPIDVRAAIIFAGTCPLHIVALALSVVGIYIPSPPADVCHCISAEAIAHLHQLKITVGVLIRICRDVVTRVIIHRVARSFIVRNVRVCLDIFIACLREVVAATLLRIIFTAPVHIVAIALAYILITAIAAERIVFIRLPQHTAHS